ncbi:ARPP-1 family domain-containing protein [Inmirania thermothiophila]|uniref:ARG and Rhodanese-Phosphatase-superfamily-associated domain-containing protein n=1 Tax=Inmirania thermothiophila TaxID=1750597 RepID=A0A3N1Y1J8_9GAMM|nr:DUF6569 family protein [Inmirania thermothiophila]ROR32695.1 hypothetical protein EDC57_1902 [Inmirania thermothiophila]
MDTIATLLEGVEAGPARSHGRLTLYPLFGPDRPRDYLLLHEAIEAGLARVTEVSEGGSVPELALVNEADRPVLLLDGQELVGAKQNRILNLTLLAPPKATLVVPVSCVEAGRWAWREAAFRDAGRVHFAMGRARKAAAVSRNLAEAGVAMADQGEIWWEIDARLARMAGVEAPTRAAAALYESREDEIERYVAAFPAAEGQLGLVAAMEGRLLGLELFDSADAFAQCAARIVRSWAVEALSPLPAGELGGIESDDPRALLEAVAAAPVRRHRAVGLGEGLRFEPSGIVGGALVWEGRLVHLMAFTEVEGGRGSGDWALARASVRARRSRR